MGYHNHADAIEELGMVGDYDDENYGDDDHGDETEDELRTRKGQFLRVEAVGSGYRETGLNGKTTEYRPNEQELEISIEDIALHATSNVTSGSVRQLLTGRTATKFRAIGTEGSYPMFDVSIGSDTAKGTAVIRKVYEQGGHAILGGGMSIGLPDETVKALGEKLPGTLRIGGIEKAKFFTSDTNDGRTLLLDHWRDHVVKGGDPDKVIAEWQFTFDTVTLSPEGYSAGWMGSLFNPRSDNARRVSGDIGIYFSGDHPLKPMIESLADHLRQAASGIVFALWVIAAALLYLGYKAT